MYHISLGSRGFPHKLRWGCGISRMYDSAVPNALDLMRRLLVALALGAIVGLERERQERAAGLRTVTMVSLGSCLFTIIGAYGFSNTDPSRVAAQIVTGIGFLGAGPIFLRQDLVRRLPTPAALSTASAIRMAAPPPHALSPRFLHPFLHAPPQAP